MITTHLKKGERVKLVGLGILQVRNRAARAGRNPKTGEAIQIKASKKVAFRASKDSRRRSDRQGIYGSRIIGLFSLNCCIAAMARVPSTASFGLTQSRMIRKYGGVHGQVDVEIGAHSKNR